MLELSEEEEEAPENAETMRILQALRGKIMLWQSALEID